MPSTRLQLARLSSVYGLMLLAGIGAVTLICAYGATLSAPPNLAAAAVGGVGAHAEPLPIRATAGAAQLSFV